MNSIKDLAYCCPYLHFHYTTLHFGRRICSEICYNTLMRMDRLLANSGYGTRSQIRELIRSGRVSLHGVVIVDPSFSVEEAQKPEIQLDGSPVQSSRYLYVCLHKPSGYLTALEDKRLPTIADLLPQELLFKGLTPVGRLDYHTTGLLLLTNNGTLSHRLTSPKWHIEKTYLVTYDGDPLTEDVRRLFASGMTLSENPGEIEKLAPAVLELLSGSTCRITITEGKTHQVKRMLAAVSRSVTALHRESVGGITLLHGPASGEIRSLTQEEILSLFDAAKMTGTPV